MRYQWKKKGWIYNVDGSATWNKSHAQVPVVDVLQDRLRIYYSTRNELGKASISYIDVKKDNPSEILYIHREPILPFGQLGTFDDSGLMPSCIIHVNDKIHLYYIGWTTRGTVPYHNAVGLAISDDHGQTFNKYAEGPIITSNIHEPYFSGTSWVMHDQQIFKMWYLSCIGWEIIESRPEPLYQINYAESPDGVHWAQTGHVAIALDEEEGGIVSAAVLKENHLFKAWYAVRKKANYRESKENSYKIGYAESPDGKEWKRLDHLSGIAPSGEGWDSEMICYPYIVSVDHNLLMFYNGNGFGKTGFGYAEGQ